jgi:hypothetical protein
MTRSWADRASSYPSNSLLSEVNSIIGRRGKKVKEYLGIFCCTALWHIILLGFDFWGVGKYKKKRVFPRNLNANKKIYLGRLGRVWAKRKKKRIMSR